MGAVVKIGLGELPRELARGEREIRTAVRRGVIAGAHRARAIMVKRTPVDQGQLKASWHVDTELSDSTPTLAELINDAPHIAIVELGARPHKVSPEGWTAIYEWVRRHYRGGTMGGKGRMRARRNVVIGGPFKGDDPVISDITNAIVYRIRTKGQKATLFVRNSVDELRNVMATELQFHLARVNERMSKRGGK